MALRLACLTVSPEVLLTRVLARSCLVQSSMLRLRFTLQSMFLLCLEQGSLHVGFLFLGKLLDYVRELADFLGLLLTGWESLFGA